MKKDVLIKLISFASALIMVAAVFIFKSDGENNDTSKEAVAIFNDFSSAIDKVSNLLDLFLKTEEENKLNEIAQNLSEELRRARQDYALLNLQNVESGLDNFLNLSGDYVLKYADDVKQGRSSSEQKQKIEKLSRVSSLFAEEISKLEPEQGENDITEEIRERYSKVNREIAEKTESEMPQSVSQNHSSVVSDNGNPLSDSKEISQERASKIAQKYIEISESTTTQRVVENKIDGYRFKTSGEEIFISAKGGFIVSFLRNEKGEAKNFSDEQCLDLAKAFLATYHSANFVPRYFESREQMCYIVFTTKNGATYCNPDRVELTISRVSGEIIEFIGEQFLLNHRNRTLQAPNHSATEAQSKIPQNLSVEQVLQVVSTFDGNEKNCYEFYCTNLDGEAELIYINALDLSVEGRIPLLKNKNSAFLK
ncbi:MAG: germination protein YpeB [Clostridia bacterium]|nr:germination protein YpeB [Clostridia bacterium]